MQRRNPFDLPYDSTEEKPDLVGDTFQQEFAVLQPKEPFFRRHESFNAGPSYFGATRSDKDNVVDLATLRQALCLIQSLFLTRT